MMAIYGDNVHTRMKTVAITVGASPHEIAIS
jgi:hypothetical protein